MGTLQAGEPFLACRNQEPKDSTILFMNFPGSTYFSCAASCHSPRAQCKGSLEEALLLKA